MAELDRQAGPRTSGARQHYIGEQSYGNWRAYEQRSEPRTRPRASAYDASTGSASRFFPTFAADGDGDGAPQPEDAVPWMYCPKASRRERNAGCESLPARKRDATGFDGAGGVAERIGEDGKRTPKAISLPEGNHHPTVKPLALMQWLVRLVTPPGGLVLDPFCGSGSTLVACVREGMGFIGIEAEPSYVEIARRRVAYEQEQQAGPLFAAASSGDS